MRVFARLKYPQSRLRPLQRVLLSHYVANGVSGALGLLWIAVLVQAFLGSAAASAAVVGAIISIPPDMPAPRCGKFLHMLPAPLLALVLFYAVLRLQGSPWTLGLLIVPASFCVFLLMAWGQRGAPAAIGAMLALVFAMALPVPAGAGAEAALHSTLYFALGAFLYLPWAVLMNALLNARYRSQLMADLLLSLAALLRLQAQQFSPLLHGGSDALTGALLRCQAALAEQLQAARDLLYEAPRRPRALQLAAMLLCVLDVRDHLLACGLDLEALRQQPAQAGALQRLQGELLAQAQALESLADALLLGRRPPPWSRPPPDTHLAPEPGAQGFTPTRLARGLAHRIGHLHLEVGRLYALESGRVPPDLAVVRAGWQMFVSPAGWSWQPLLRLWRWRAPALRHALRAALAVGAGYAVAQQLPWGTHAYWVVLTIVVVLRGSLAQTLQRRNARVAGTLLGCLLAALLLAAQLPGWALLLCVTLAQAVVHAFTVRRYWVAAVAATVLGLVQSHLLHGGGDSTAFALFERLADTLLGAAMAWGFAYVLPSWERHQVPALVARTLAAQSRHAREALALGQLQAVDNHPELAWRLARREVFDSLAALVQASERAWQEPRAVRPPLLPLERLQIHCYQLLAQLTAIKTMLLLRRGHLNSEDIRAPLQQAGAHIEALLAGAPAPALDADADADADAGAAVGQAPSAPEIDLTPWLLRRLALAQELARQLRSEAQVLLAIK